MISKKALAKINKALDRYKALLKYLSVGPQSLTKEQLKDLVASGALNQFKGHGGKAIEAYLLTHEQITTTPGKHKSHQKGALEFIDRMFDRYIGKAADQFKADVLSNLESQAISFTDRREGATVYEALHDPDLFKKNLRKLLKDQVDNWEYRYRTIITTELNRASNWGAMDAILHNNKDKDPSEIYVFKQGHQPGDGACKHCIDFWYTEDFRTPRVYKLSELIGNGSNIGKKKNDWLPTVDSTHPNESHILHYLPAGYGFKDGQMVFINKGHDEYKKQRNQ